MNFHGKIAILSYLYLYLSVGNRRPRFALGSARNLGAALALELALFRAHRDVTDAPESHNRAPVISC